MPIIETIINKKTLNYTIHGEQKSFIVSATFNEISELLNNKDINNLKDPPYQTDLDETRIEDMYESYKKNPNFFLSKLLLTFVIILNEGENKLDYYLVDGQHRGEMIKKLHNDKETEINTVFCVFHRINNDTECEQLFIELNKDSYKNAKYISFPSLKKSKINDFKNKLKSTYPDMFSKQKTPKAHCYAINEFTDLLDEQKYFDNFENKNVDDIMADIKTKHTNFISIMKYLENKDNEKLFYKSELDKINMKNVLFFKHNNIIDYICDPNTTIPQHEYRNIHSFTKKEREQVWKETYEDAKVGICSISGCNCKLYLEKKYGFQLGHIISKYNKGSDELANVKPICANCNQQMGIQNWSDFEAIQKKIYIWKKKYPDIEGQECKHGKCDNCNSDISIKKFEYKMIKNNKKKTKYLYVCKTCFGK
jgi:hypothetical protein